MAEIELAHKEVVDKLSFTDNYNTEAAQNKAGKTKGSTWVMEISASLIYYYKLMERILF